MKGVIVGIIIVLLLLVGGYFAYNYFTTGQVNVYIQDPPGQSSSNVAIYLVVSSIMLHKVNATGNPWVTVSNKTVVVKLSSNATFLASARVPAGEYNEVFLEVKQAIVQIGNTNVTATLPSGVFKIHITGGMRLSGGSTENLIIELPGVHFANGEVIINPSVTAYVQG